MKETYPIVLNKKMYVGVGNDEIEYITGETILNPESIEERKTWYKTARVSIINEFEQVCNLLVAGDTENAVEIANTINEYLKRQEAEYPACVFKFKKRIKELLENG